jgi:hypothetical protein
VTFLIIALIAVAVVVIALLVVRFARPVDGVEQFQRQIDALSPEARRPVVDQVAQLDDEAVTNADDADALLPPDEAVPPAPAEDEAGDDDGGSDGTEPRP